jgi:hypothetical protein
MDILTDRPKRSSNTPRKTGLNGWDFAHHALKLLVTSGYGMSVLLLGSLVTIVWIIFGNMSSSDQKEALLFILGSKVVAVGGWVVAVATIALARYLLNFQAKSFRMEYERLKSVKDDALRIQEKLPLDMNKDRE